MANKYEDVIKKLESEQKYGDFVHNLENFHYEPINSDFDYKKIGVFPCLFGFLIKGLIVVIIPTFLRIKHSLKFEGKENYKKIKNKTFIAICNHTQTLDCGFSRTAVLSKKFFVTSAEQNNKKKWRGKLLRAIGAVPIGNTLQAQKKFDEHLNYLSTKNCVIHFYPEHASWPEYRKVRPFSRGAFYYAVKNNLPILPEFLYYRTSENDKNKSSKITLRYLEPIFPNMEMNVRSRIKYMQDKAQWQYNMAYKDVYNKDDFIVQINNPDEHLQDYLA